MKDNMEHLNAFIEENLWSDLAELYETATRGAYTVDDNGNTCALRTGRDGSTYSEPIADFVIVPRETIVHVYGQKRFVEHILSGYDYKRRVLPLVSVPAQKLASFNWVVEKWRGAVIYSGQQKRDRLREAVLMVERETATRKEVFYGNTNRQPRKGPCYFSHA